MPRILNGEVPFATMRRPHCNATTQVPYKMAMATAVDNTTSRSPHVHKDVECSLQILNSISAQFEAKRTHHSNALYHTPNSNNKVTLQRRQLR